MFPQYQLSIALIFYHMIPVRSFETTDEFENTIDTPLNISPMWLLSIMGVCNKNLFISFKFYD
jgi:hypothetical protein